jgi:Putative transposase
VEENWFVYAKRPFAGPEPVLAYLARYTHRVAISNSRLLALDERGVTFRYKDYRRNGRARYRTMTLAPDKFIRRFLLHILPKGFHRIRHYGLLASAAYKTNIARAREPPAMPLLRRPHDHRRDLRARRRTPRPPSPDVWVRTATP